MKRTFKMALIASLAVGGSYVLYGSQNKEELSDLALSNVEALTLGTKDCMYQRNSRCYELVVGPPGEPVIIETSEEANWVNRYTCLLYTSPSPRDRSVSRMPSSA